MFWWLFLAASPPAHADIAPPTPPEPACDLRRCPGQEARWCGPEEADDACPPPDADGWTSACTRRSQTLYCRDFRALPDKPPPQPSPPLAALLTGEGLDRARLRPPPRLRWPGESHPTALSEGIDWTLPLPAWTAPDAAVQVAVALAAPLEGLVLLDVLPEALEPVLVEPLPLFDQPEGASIGVLLPGTRAPSALARAQDVLPREGWSPLQLPAGLPLTTAWTSQEYGTGPTYTPAPSPEGTPLCLASGSPLSATPGGAPLTTTAEDCPAGWVQVAESEGWVQAAHTSGIRLWTPASGIRLGMSAGSLGGGGLGLGGIGLGGSSTPRVWHTVSAPVWLYGVPGGAVVGRLARGRVVVEQAQADGWWLTRVDSLAGERSAWIAPEVPVAAATAGGAGEAPTGAEPPTAAEETGCQVAEGGWSGLWLAGALAAGCRRRRASEAVLRVDEGATA